jgi:hypothetical protein
MIISGRLLSEKDDTRRRYRIKLTATQEITPYQWVHPDEER